MNASRRSAGCSSAFCECGTKDCPPKVVHSLSRLLHNLLRHTRRSLYARRLQRSSHNRVAQSVAVVPLSSCTIIRRCPGTSMDLQNSRCRRCPVASTYLPHSECGLPRWTCRARGVGGVLLPRLTCSFGIAKQLYTQNQPVKNVIGQPPAGIFSYISIGCNPRNCAEHNQGPSGSPSTRIFGRAAAVPVRQIELSRTTRAE